MLITGASSGVGLAATEAFAREGAELALIARGRPPLEEAAATARRHGVSAHVLPADLGDREQARAAVEAAVAALGGLDIVVSNAASAVFGHVSEVDPDDFDRAISVTFRGAVTVITTALPHLRASRGRIVATGSLMAHLPLPTYASYAAAKHALRGFLNTLSIEEREQKTGVRVAMVHPGPIDTPLFSRVSSATGRKPRLPPDAYRADVVAQALVEAAVAKRPKPERTLGGVTRLVELLYGLARWPAELVLIFVDRWYRSEPAPAGAGSLYAPAAQAVRSGGIPSRDSLLAPLQFGSRLRPRAATPLHLARNLASSAIRAVQLRRALTGPQPETPRAQADGLPRVEAGDSPLVAGGERARAG